jgi:aerobic carbon-monoxide dehydrogenase large subunit
MPTCHEVPDGEVLIREDSPSPLNPLGAKCAREGGITGAAPASAIDAALQQPGAVNRLPITPECLHRILHRGRG